MEPPASTAFVFARVHPPLFLRRKSAATAIKMST